MRLLFRNIACYPEEMLVIQKKISVYGNVRRHRKCRENHFQKTSRFLNLFSQMKRLICEKAKVKISFFRKGVRGITLFSLEKRVSPEKISDKMDFRGRE